MTTAVTEDTVTEDVDTPTVEPAEEPTVRRRRPSWTRLLGYVVLPALALLLAAAAGWMKWQNDSHRQAQIAAMEAVPAATDAAVAMLSYQAESVEADLQAASDRLSGDFREEYTRLINDLVIPGAKEKSISSTATVPIAATVSADGKQAVVLAFVNQSTFIGTDPPTESASSVLITLDKDGDRWLVSAFEPI